MQLKTSQLYFIMSAILSNENNAETLSKKITKIGTDHEKQMI